MLVVTMVAVLLTINFPNGTGIAFYPQVRAAQHSRRGAPIWKDDATVVPMPYLFWMSVPFALMEMWWKEYERSRDQS